MDNLVSEIFKGADVSTQYNLLDDEHKLGVCNEVCATLAKQLDEENKENISTVGKFMQVPSLEHALS